MVRWFAWLILFISSGAAIAQPYDGPPNGADYWTVPAYKQFPLKGPQVAKGLILWSHGVYRREAQYQYPPAPIMQRFARAGWDVIKVQRNPRNERGWIPSGVRHVHDLVERVNQAKANGYRQVFVAGQSYGGAISIEASARTTAIDGVIALAPGHGSDAESGGSARIFDMLTDQLIGAIDKAQAPRMLVMIAEGDVYTPFEVRGPRLRAALDRRAKPYILFDETMPLKGHGAGETPQFDQWYGVCIMAFMTKLEAPPGETRCGGPQVVGKFALPTDVKVAAPAADTSPTFAALAGRWSGTMSGPNTGDREAMLVFEKFDANRVSFLYALDRGAEGKFAPFYSRRIATWSGTAFESRNNTGNFSIVFGPPVNGVMPLIVTGETGATYKATLRREAGS